MILTCRHQENAMEVYLEMCGFTGYGWTCCYEDFESWPSPAEEALDPTTRDTLIKELQAWWNLNESLKLLIDHRMTVAEMRPRDIDAGWNR